MKQIKGFLVVILSSFMVFSCSTENTPVYQLTTSSNPAEAGTVTPAEGEYDEGTEVSITATPNEGWIFDTWQGDLTDSENPQTLSMDSDKQITALFIKKTYPLTVTIEGEGDVLEEVIQEKSTDYEHGTRVELTAQPEYGWEFVEWSGALESSENRIQLTVEEPAEITAVFETSNTFFLAENGITIKCPGAEVGEKGMIDGIEYEAVDRQLLEQRINEETDLTKVCTSLVTDMSSLFMENAFFNQPIGSWDVSNVTNMANMFYITSFFNQPIDSWDVSSVTNMKYMFFATDSFNQPLENWNVSNVTNMKGLFSGAIVFNQSVGSWDVSNVTDMSRMFATPSFDQPIGNWDVSKVTDMSEMFFNANAFNHPLENWDVSNVTDMSGMFTSAGIFNQPIGNWTVGNVTDMSGMFARATKFNQPIGGWDVSNVTNMNGMLRDTNVFNQPIGDWDVSKVTDMMTMFRRAESFNQPIGNWNVSSVEGMFGMFKFAGMFNQDLGDWDVSNVIYMGSMFEWAEQFNKDLTPWCVTNIPSEPEHFSDKSPLENENKPIWGTCPD